MNELIPISDNNGKKAVSARLLHDFLESKERFSAWTKRMFKYGFVEGTDFIGCSEFNALANQQLADYILTIDCAKEISMLQRSEKGKQARQYFIECEKIASGSTQVLHPPQTYSEALRELADKSEENEQLKTTIVHQEPYVEFAKSVQKSDTCISVAEMAQILKQNKLFRFGQNRFYDWLRLMGYVNSRGMRRNLPTQRSINMGIMRIAEEVVNGVHINRKTVITGYGQSFFLNLFRENKNRHNDSMNMFML